MEEKTCAIVRECYSPLVGIVSGCLCGAGAMCSLSTVQTKDSNGMNKDGLWHGFRNVCFLAANYCKDSFFPGTNDEENDGIAGITAKSDLSWLKMNCGVDFEMFDGNGLQSALL